MSATFTKGEWEIYRGDSAMNDRTVCQLTPMVSILSDRYVDGSPMDDALLIAAAPDMYALLNDILDNYETDTHMDNQISVILSKVRGKQ